MITVAFAFLNVSDPLQDFNSKLSDGVVYVCNSYGRADLKCPCGCGDIITLNLIKDARPVWTINGNTITPSINRLIGCRSHFSITNEQIN